MSLTNDTVVSKLAKKTSSGFTTYNIGPELRYTGTTRNSGNNNLEEEILLGTDNDNTYTETYVTEDGQGNPLAVPYVERIESINFKIDGSSDSYYKMSKTTQSELPMELDANSNKLILKTSPKIYKEIDVLSFYHADTATQENISKKIIDYTYGGNNTIVETEIQQLS